MRRRVVRSLVMVAFCALTKILHSQGARAQGSCSNSQEDEIIIEYMNMLSFDEEISVSIVDKGTQFVVSLACPPPFSPTLPPDDFHLQLSSTDQAHVSSCEGGSIILDKSQLKQKRIPFCANGIVCNFVIELSNRETAAVYSTTDLEITMTNGNSTLIPQLEPATMPVCGNTINQCLTINACTLSSEPVGAISLCDSQQCASQPNADGYSYNESAYFDMITR